MVLVGVQVVMGVRYESRRVGMFPSIGREFTYRVGVEPFAGFASNLVSQLQSYLFGASGDSDRTAEPVSSELMTKSA